MGLMGLDCNMITQLDLLCVKLDDSDLLRVDSIESMTVVCQA